MAVIEDLPHIRVFVRLAGSSVGCTEYDDPDPPYTPASTGTAAHTVSKVIESHNDAEFEIYIELDNSLYQFQDGHGVAIDCYIDGKKVNTTISVKKRLIGQTDSYAVEGLRLLSAETGKMTLRKFKFSAVKTVEGRNDKLAEDREAVKHLGVVEIVAYRAIRLGVSAFKPCIVRPKAELAEKAMKGKSVSHGTSFSDEVETSEIPSSHFSKPDGDRRLARFFFRYKSRAMLQAEGIIPRDPSPPQQPTVPVPPAIDSLSQEELRQLAQERLSQIYAVKQEGQAGVRVKREASVELDGRLRKVYKTDADGVIDLTDEW